jgi:SAM-dependent methyltransferase
MTKVTLLSHVDDVNRRAWKRRGALRAYGSSEGFSDAGEKAAFALIQDDILSARVLDLGVGGGRTSRIILAQTSDYVGLDYTAELVEICRAKFPGVTFICGDARDLSCFSSESFAVVVFSFNGICSVDEEGRQAVFREVFRILAPKGVFLFSTFILPDQDHAPRAITTRRFVLSKRPLESALSLAKLIGGTAVGLSRRLYYRSLERSSPDAALLLHGAHDYGFLAYRSSMQLLRRHLQDTGFSGPMTVIARSGKVINDRDQIDEEYYHVIVRKA